MIDHISIKNFATIENTEIDLSDGLNIITGEEDADEGRVLASPALEAAHIDAALIHEAAIGKIAGEQLLKLQSLGLTAEEAEEKIIAGFLK